VHHYVPVHLQLPYKGRIKISSDMIITEGLANEIISLPMYPELIFKDAELLVHVLKEVM